MVTFPLLKIDRFNRLMRMSREKRLAVMERHSRLILYILKKYGFGKPISYTEYVADKKLQIQINARNKQLKAGE